MVIVGNIGNIVFLTEEGITGLHFEYIGALKNAVGRMKSMDIETMEENAYRKYKAEFTNKKNYSVLKAMYDSVTNR